MVERFNRRTTDGQNDQGKPAKDTRKKRGDATTEPTSSGLKGYVKRTVHFFKDAVIYSTATTAVFSNLALAESLPHNNQYALDVRDGGSTQLSRRDASSSALESRHRSNSIDYPSRDTCWNHDEFPQKILIGDSRVAMPTTDDIGRLLNDKRLLLESLKSVCENPRHFNQLVSNENFRFIILSIAQDNDVLDFMYNLCDEVKIAFLGTSEDILNSLNKGETRRLNSLIKAIGNLLESRDKSAQSLPSYEETSKGFSHEAVIQRPSELSNKFTDHQHEKDCMGAMQDTRDKEMRLDIWDDLVRHSREKESVRMNQDAKEKENARMNQDAKEKESVRVNQDAKEKERIVDNTDYVVRQGHEKDSMWAMQDIKNTEKLLEFAHKVIDSMQAMPDVKDKEKLLELAHKVVQLYENDSMRAMQDIKDMEKLLGIVDNMMRQSHEKDIMREVQDAKYKEKLLGVMDNMMRQSYEKDNMRAISNAKEEEKHFENMDHMVHQGYEKDSMWMEQDSKKMYNRWIGPIAWGVVILGAACFFCECKSRPEPLQPEYTHNRESVDNSNDIIYFGDPVTVEHSKAQDRRLRQQQ